MINVNNISNFYFIGIGGIGMSSLARYFNHQGKKVAGYDLNSTSLTTELIKEGIEIHFEDNVNTISDSFKVKENTVIVITPAVPVSHSELIWFKESGFSIHKRAEVLGWVTQNNRTIAVAGTHGKTTTSCLIAHILTESGVGCHAFLGGISGNYNTNFIYSNHSNIAVVEADEYDRSFLKLSPEISIITSMDADHLEIYGNHSEMVKTYLEFANKASNTLVSKNELNIKGDKNNITYSILNTADVYTQNIEVKNGNYQYSIKSSLGDLNNVSLGLPGRHNIENSLAAVAVAQSLGIENEKIKNALASFKGVKRRFETIVKNNSVTYIDDYAHHPAELKATISSAKELYADKKITGIFQPHLFSRTRDFVNEFAESLSLLDEIILLDIYPARELPMEGITSKIILDKITNEKKQILSKNDCLNYILKNKPTVLLTMGAGDIDKLVAPLKEILE